jgi:hypothetical protein
LSHLILESTPAGYGYTLGRHPLTNGDWIEVHSAITQNDWLRGQFIWNGDPQVRPTLLRRGRRMTIVAADEVRWHQFVRPTIPLTASVPATTAPTEGGRRAKA